MVCACTVVSLAHVELEKGVGMSEIVVRVVGLGFGFFFEFGFFFCCCSLIFLNAQPRSAEQVEG